jgi:transcriptional regulator with XRE-family HTH domain
VFFEFLWFDKLCGSKTMDGSIGERVRSLRTGKGMTLGELGEKVRLSASYLSQIERDRTIPSLNTLMNIARALEVEPRYFFDSDNQSTLVLRAGQARQPETVTAAMICDRISPEDESNNLKVYRVCIQPHSPPQVIDPLRGEGLCFVLSGELTIRVGDEQYRLKAGDSIHYDGLLLHSWSNPGDGLCELIWSQARSLHK